MAVSSQPGTDSGLDDRNAACVLPGQPVIDDGDMMLWRALPQEARISLGPFVFIDHYRHRSRRGIGDRPHPHAGIEVLSYLLEGAMQHRDSMGFSDRIGAGDAQSICAGRGILHAETPEGGRHGLQLWTSLPPALKHAPPTYRRIPAQDIPELLVGDARVRVLAGTVQGTHGPLVLARDTTFAHVRLPAGGQTRLAVNTDAELGMYLLQGSASLGETSSYSVGQLVVLTPGSHVALVAESDCDLVILGGSKIDEMVLFGGPFVMDTPERLLQARKDFMEGRMGTLDGVPF